MSVPVPQNVSAFCVRLCGASRPGDERADRFVDDYVAWGADPRGTQNLALAAKARALLEGRTAPTTANVTRVEKSLLRHRLIDNHRAVGDGITPEAAVDHLLKKVTE